MVSSPANSTGRPRRRLLAAILALLWALYTLLGASSLCARASAHGTVPPSRAVVSTSPSAPVCHCKMCHGIRRDGKMVCCCGKAAQTAQQQAVIAVRCDQGAPAALAAVTSWPVVQPVLAAAVFPSLTGQQFARPADSSALSLSPRPLTPPPCVL